MIETTSPYILVVEDSRTQAAMLRRFLQQNGYQVETCAEGVAALETARQRLPDLVISDVMMPLMDGYTLCSAMRAHPELSDVPVMLLTNLSNPTDIVRGLQVGADYYLTKPYDEAYLLSMVAEILAQPQLGPCAEGALEVEVSGRRYVIEAGRRRMLNLLLSTYGNAVQQNRVLLQTQQELMTLNSKLVAQRQQIAAQERELHEANLRLREQATRDALTDLRNYRAFSERLHEEIARAVRRQEELSCLLIDVDYFKRYNDSFGHPAGDVALKQVGQILEAQARNEDLVARYGGEEFAVLLPSTRADYARVVAQRMGKAIREAHWPHRSLTVSIGIATSQARPEAEALLAQADAALYASKDLGRDQVNHFLDIGEEAQNKYRKREK
ncbi:MAG TPA: diguanylate cyclase [Abditibacterium sp.]|jgi:diguanylate cyclase (GGDEF)-like protein